MYTRMHAFARLIASHHTVKVHDVTAEHCAPCAIKSPILFTRRPRSEHGLSQGDKQYETMPEATLD